MAMARVTYTLWQGFLRFDPEDPISCGFGTDFPCGTDFRGAGFRKRPRAGTCCNRADTCPQALLVYAHQPARPAGAGAPGGPPPR